MRRRLPTRTIVVVAVVLAIGVAAAYLIGRNRLPAPAAAGDAPGRPAVTTVRAADGTVDETVATQGRIGPPAGSDAKLAFPLTGTLASIDVRVGDRVTEGEALASLDRRALANAVDQARADAGAATAQYAGGATGNAAASSAASKLAAASARLANLQAGGQAALSDRIAAVSAARQAAVKARLDQQTLERTTTLFAGGVAAQKDVAAARAQVQSDLADQRSADARVAAAGAGYDAAVRTAQSDVAQARSDLATANAGGNAARATRAAALSRLAAARLDYERGVLVAPSDGVVLAILKHPGESVDPTSPVVDVAPPQRRAITLTVPGRDAVRVRVGNPVRLTLTSSARHADGTVTAVVPAVDPTTQLTTVVVEGLPADAIAGEAVSASIVVAHVTGIVLPSTAAVTDPETGKTVVFAYDASSKDTPFASKPVDVAANDGARIVVRGAVRAGDRIASTGAYALLAPASGGG